MALLICQMLHEHIAQQSAMLGPHNYFCDWKPVPAVPSDEKVIHTEYVDNFLALSNVETTAKSAADSVRDNLNLSGLPTHTATVSRGGSALGWEFSETSANVSVSRSSTWRLRMGITGLLQRNKVSGKELSKITGHFTFRALIRRELLSCLSAVFAFEERHWNERTVLWDSVKTELIHCRDLLPLARRDLGAP